MDPTGVLMACPIWLHLEEELKKHFKLFKLWNFEDKVRFLDDHKNIVRAVVGSATAGADGDLIEELPNLEVVSTFSMGLDKIDLEKCRQKGIQVTNTPDVLTDDVADLAIGLILAVLRRICECDWYMRGASWKNGDYKLSTQFSGKTVGIIGLGRIGTTIARRTKAFDCSISYHSRTEKPESGYKQYPSAVELASNCQILIVARSPTGKTRHIVNREVIDAFGPKGFLINIARGPLVEEPELVSALLEGRFGGSGIDVFENEPNVPEQLLRLENVALFPHAGSATVETRKAMADLVIENLKAHFQQNPPLTPV